MSNVTDVFCMGDSHIEMFGAVHRKNLLPSTRFTTFLVGGATGLGLSNPQSHTQANKKFKRRIQQISKSTYILMMLGEVDCGFVIWWAADNKGEDVQSQLLRSFTNYTSFVDDLYQDGYTKIILATCPLPTIPDGVARGSVAKMREAVSATQLQRTELTHQYNSLLRIHAREKGYLFLDYESDIIDPLTHLVAKKYCHSNPRNHHLDNAQMAPILAQRLKDLGFH